MFSLAIVLLFCYISLSNSVVTYTSYRVLTISSTARIACNNMKIQILRSVEQCLDTKYSHTKEIRFKCNDKSFCNISHSTHCKDPVINLYYTCKDSYLYNKTATNRHIKVNTFACDEHPIHAFCKDKLLINPLEILLFGVDDDPNYHELIKNKCLLKNLCIINLSDIVNSKRIELVDVFAQFVYNCDTEKNIINGKEFESIKPVWNSAWNVRGIENPNYMRNDEYTPNDSKNIFNITKVKPIYIDGYSLALPPNQDANHKHMDESDDYDGYQGDQPVESKPQNYSDDKDAPYDAVYACYVKDEKLAQLMNINAPLELSMVCTDYDCKFAIRECQPGNFISKSN